MAKKRKLGNISHKSHFVDSGRKRNGAGGPPQNNNKKKNSQSAHAAESDAKKKKQQQQYHQNQEPVIPFAPEDSILLVGEGDLSFAASLAVHHGCRNVTATVLEKNERELLEKYPHASENIALINNPAKPKPAPAGPKPATDKGEGEGEDGESKEAGDDYDDDEDDGGDYAAAADEEEFDEDDDEKYKPPVINNNKILYNVDCRTMKPFTRKSAPNHRGFHMSAPSKQGMFKRILFNFPHVGGKSTDRNRQVRYNQELLVAFFNSAIPSLAPGGTIVITLFEGDPYTLWNVKDLGRHAGLQSLQSFRFHSRAYPGYKHARTLGVVREKKTGEASGAAWKGEERPARSYIFMRKDEAPEELPGKKKRKRGGDESSSEEESEVENFDD
ncbi:25S rRNA (uridine-N(3))-methyltransferase [Colletotrichum shisoi]|uniref:25S rRNA (Uridine-N(3))-methyltransferase n=1 Tax=Colletotrichum shisoi TaxID=2078593 RepID=A0A5Q4C350_9PEZI|nr:25S rRNA (uridine-N(3))-methyltransferase [Colletotrichum shisoi]